MRADKKKGVPTEKPATVYEDSKRKLSKTVAELEWWLHEEEKKNSIMINKVKQSTTDKDKYKQKYSLLKTQIMNQEADKNWMYKQTSSNLEDPVTPVGGNNEGSPTA